MKRTQTILGVCALVVLLVTMSQADSSLDQLIQKLAQKVNSYQALVEQNYTSPFHWYEKKGLFRSEIRINLFGNPAFHAFRTNEIFAVYDNDMFSTGWIVTALLEASLYGKGAPEFDSHRLEIALDAIANYNNKNDADSKHSIERTFWPQLYNFSSNTWFQQPINIANVASELNRIPFDQIEAFLKKINLEKFAEFIDEFKELGKAADAFGIPADFDDTYLNLGLGATLSLLGDKYSQVYKSWLSNNTNIQNLINATEYYAYRPFDSDSNANTIDPRTFFWARGFVQEASDKNQPLSLITTWIQNIDEQRKLRAQKVAMPFNVNNVDVTVAANSIYGMTSAALFNINQFGDKFLQSPDLIQTYLNSTKFISWAITSNFTGRPDLALVYYPSNFKHSRSLFIIKLSFLGTYNFMWYASRTLFLIENEYQKFSHMAAHKDEHYDEAKFVHLSSLRDILTEAKFYLEDTFKTTVTKFLLREAVKASANQTYFRDFLGMNDTSIFGKPVSHDEDALFSTAQAINILISTWTYQGFNHSLQWHENTPPYAKQLLTTSVNWLKEHILDSRYKPFNAFFSGSFKGLQSIPFWYPSNYNQFLNGTKGN